MKKYIIISIEENHIDPEGHALIIKANPVKEDSMFKELRKMFGLKYYSISKEENSDTEIFIYPYTLKTLDNFLGIVNGKGENKFWTPHFNLFHDSYLKIGDGEKKIVHKSIGFRMLNQPKPIEERIVFLPPVSEWQFRHKNIMGCRCILYPATYAILNVFSEEKFSTQSGGIAYLVFPDNNYYNNMLLDAIKLDTCKKEFWEPQIDNFRNYKIDVSNPLSHTSHDLYISKELSAELLMNNLQELFRKS